MSEYIVLIGSRFLGWGGDPVREYPDAEKFKSWSKADRAAEELPPSMEGVLVVSVEDYQAGTYEEA